MFAWTIYISFLGAAACAFIRRPALARTFALSTAAAGLAAGVIGALQMPTAGLHTIVRSDWIPQLGIRYFLAADGISVTLVLLTGIAAVAGILFSWNITDRTGEFFALYLTLIGGVYGVFLSFDLFLLFVFYEIAIIPKYFLIAIWGSTRREYGAMKLALYSFAGSAMVLAGMIITYSASGAHSMDLQVLTRTPLDHSMQLWVFPLVFVGFAVLAGMWPFHTWAPTGHVAAPTGASMLLAGVVMKLGAYGCLRVALPLYPEGLSSPLFSLAGIHSWGDIFAVLSLIGIVYGALSAMVQTDLKFVIGYSSVSHMGFVLLGMLTLQIQGLAGSVLQMFSHGIIAGLLFAVVGRIIYERTHTRELARLGEFRLGKALPMGALIFTAATMASMGMPGFSGFVAELQVLIGAWHSYPTLAVLAGVGILIGVAYNLRALQGSFFREPAENSSSTGSKVPSLTLPEKCGSAVLVLATLVAGIYPDLLLAWIVPALRSPYFEKLLPGGIP